MAERAKFKSKLGIILATAGSAVGLGNVWRFPYMTGENGGATFIILYLACIFILGIPCIVSEFIIGRHGAANAVRSYEKLSNGTPWRFIGFFGIVTGFLIISYYAVVSGWCLQYLFGSALGHLKGDPTYIKDYFISFSQSAWKPIFWTVVFLFITHFVITRGVQKGIEWASKLLMPVLFVLLLIIVVSSCLLPNASEGIRFIFYPDFSKVTSDTILGALGQAFYSLSIGMGCLCTYASYFSHETNLTKSAVHISLIDSLIAILAGLMIFPAAFSVNVQPDSGPSLIFITLPNVFLEAFSSVPIIGYIISLLFYALLALAALTSLISLHEVCTAFIHEEFHLTRNRAAMIVTLSCAVIGAFCSLSLGAWDDLQLFGKSLFNLFDFVTGQILLPVGSFFTCLFLGWYVPKKIVKDEFTNWGTLSGTFFGLFLFSIRFICPIAIAMIFLHQLGCI